MVFEIFPRLKISIIILAMCLVALCARLEADSDTTVVMDYNKTSDYAVAAWTSMNGMFVIQASTFTTGGGWTPLADISNPAFDSTHPLVSVNDSGDAVAVWFFFDSGLSIHSLASATLPSGGVWSAPVVISGAQDVAVTLKPTIRLSNTGNLTATWSAFVGSNHKVFAATGTFPAWAGLSTIQITP